MNPEEMDQEAKRIAHAVAEERDDAERRAERIANAANAATIERAAETALITQAVDDARCKQMAELKGTMGFQRWMITGLFGVLGVALGILVPIWLDRPMIKYNTWRLDKMEVEYPKTMDELKRISEKNANVLSENSEKLNEMKTMLIALKARQ